MSENATAASGAVGQGAAAIPAGQTYIQHGDHIDTIESVNAVFVAQRRLSFSYGAVFFLVTLAVPALSVWAPAWYATPVWGGLTWNYIFVALIYFVFLWVMAWTYSKQADKLDEDLLRLADDIEAKVKAGEAA